MLSQKIRDKDGVSAAVRLPPFSSLTYSPSLTAPPLPLSLDVQACFAELASSLYARGSTLKAHLEELYAKFVSVAPPRLFFLSSSPSSHPHLASFFCLHRYGTFITRNSYFICNDPSTTEKIFQRLRYAFPSSDEDETPSVPLPHSVDPNPLVFGRDGTPFVVSRSQAAAVEARFFPSPPSLSSLSPSRPKLLTKPSLPPSFSPPFSHRPNPPSPETSVPSNPQPPSGASPSRPSEISRSDTTRPTRLRTSLICPTVEGR